MHLLVGTDSVHTTATICDYLERRSTATAVTVMSVVTRDHTGDRVTRDDGTDTTRRDAEDALNVARVRLAVDHLETVCRSGEPAMVLLEAATELDVDELVVGNRSGHPDAHGDSGSTIQTLLTESERPIVVVPMGE